MNLAELLTKENIFIAGSYNDTDSFYSDFSAFLKQKGIINEKENVKRLFVKRETVHSTAIGKGAAAPHIFSPEFSEFLLSVALVKEGVDFKAPDGQKVYLVFLIMSDERDVGRHLKTLAHIARLVSSTDVVENVKEAAGADEVYAAILENEKLI
ncbi:MAG: PTS sugar transporter subunit IIA [bacterium]|nr:PTS sugar transporter subunit IIA [bacterium]